MRLFEAATLRDNLGVGNVAGEGSSAGEDVDSGEREEPRDPDEATLSEAADDED